MRHTLRLFEYYKTYDRFFTENNIKVDLEDIEKYYLEFSSSTALRKFDRYSREFFDYLINRFHILQVFDQYHYSVPMVYRGYKANYEFNTELDKYIGFVENELDSSIEGKNLKEIEEDFHNVVDFVVSLR